MSKGTIVALEDKPHNKCRKWQFEDIAQQDFRPTDEYKQRMDETFIFHDGKCSKRVYEAIKALDEK